ncbi:hypothetical protein CEXT_412361 [Caerostris extrusa]|uniref:Uncharacterized protein n=1 Tax=Caerostris extrusa TaxID=172846 RepID=A0AAV4QWD6_CAEEX|nr:hypothetical protein CEXT_412361 [Caerostris extrusa]
MQTYKRKKKELVITRKSDSKCLRTNVHIHFTRHTTITIFRSPFSIPFYRLPTGLRHESTNFLKSADDYPFSRLQDPLFSIRGIKKKKWRQLFKMHPLGMQPDLQSNLLCKRGRIAHASCVHSRVAKSSKNGRLVMNARKNFLSHDRTQLRGLLPPFG